MFAKDGNSLKVIVGDAEHENGPRKENFPGKLALHSAGHLFFSTYFSTSLRHLRYIFKKNISFYLLSHFINNSVPPLPSFTHTNYKKKSI
jgi:hypothetical protein